MHLENELSLSEFADFEIEAAPDDTPSDADRQRQFVAALIGSASLALGLVGNVLLYANPVGINLLLYVAVGLGVAFGLLRYLRHPVAVHHAAFAVPALIFAGLLGVRLAPQLVLFNFAAMTGSLLVVIHFTGTPLFLGGRWSEPLKRTLETLVTGWMKSLRAVLPDSLRWFGQTELNNRQVTTLRSVLRGALIALPVAAVFTMLLSSADLVFADAATDALLFFLPDNAPSVVGQAMTIAFLTMVALTGYYTLLRDWEEREDVPMPGKPGRLRLNIIEASTVLGSINVLFVAFVGIQARYFFGGEANITAQGYTYADYARRGFYELLAVSCMTMLLLIVLESLTYRKREEEKVFRALVALMVGLTFVILAAAFQRLALYESAYGYTRVRVMSGTFMIWLALLLGALLVAILRHRPIVFTVACVVTAMGFVLTLNVINLDGFIARHNIARFEDTGRLDVPYLLSLSDDAIPTVAALIDDPALDVFEREQLLDGLRARLAALDVDRDERGLLSYHAGTSRAWRALDERRDVLKSDLTIFK
ncbi:DUF4153 domain-containing protein [Aggregatilinea lenta]|uniref:DUF4153 domain-containing protein n=1 Tax=Aggregatilinea lenta TaxID=913108 RepID=UPI000E5A4319|nr:DUF4173 domain-containing protein [Aggregatilinea lenta]